MDVWGTLHRFKSEWKLLAPILVAAAAGIIFGWYYYWQVGQFDPSSFRFRAYGWWPLVSDSPNAVLVWVIAVVTAKITGKRWWWLDSTAFILNMYVGLWTTATFLIYPETMHTFDWAGVLDGNMNPVLFISHMGMPLLALTLVKDLRQDAIHVVAVVVGVALAAAFVWVDYWGPHLHPAPFLHDFAHGDITLHAVAPWLMVVTVLAWLATAWRSKVVVAQEAPRHE